MSQPSYLKKICPACGAAGVALQLSGSVARFPVYICSECDRQLVPRVTARALLGFAVVVVGLALMYLSFLAGVHYGWPGMLRTALISGLAGGTITMAYGLVARHTILEVRS